MVTPSPPFLTSNNSVPPHHPPPTHTHLPLSYPTQVKKKKRAPKVGYARDEEVEESSPAPPQPAARQPATTVPPPASPTTTTTPSYMQSREEALHKARMVGTGIVVAVPSAGGEEDREAETQSVQSEQSDENDGHGPSDKYVVGGDVRGGSGSSMCVWKSDCCMVWDII